MKAKKLLATVLSASLLCGTLVGCGSSGSSTGAADDSSSKGKTIKVFQLKFEIRSML